jgi:hypothetical protein
VPVPKAPKWYLFFVDFFCSVRGLAKSAWYLRYLRYLRYRYLELMMPCIPAYTCKLVYDKYSIKNCRHLRSLW